MIGMGVKMDISQEKRKELLVMAYKNGYSYFEYSTIEIQDNEHLSILCGDSFGSNSLKQTYLQIEDEFGFERGKHDWDNFGIYGIIEDASVCYEKGARDALGNKEHNPDSVSHMWDY